MKKINTANVCFSVFAVLLALAASSVRADALYSFENDGKTYVVTVAEGEIATLADGDGPAEVLNANGVTNFVKRGDGTLKVSASLASFTGDLYVEDGVYSSSPQESSAPNLTAGAHGSAIIYIRPGATFDFDTSASGHYLSREWRITGRGHADPAADELGALHSTASGQALGAVSGKVVLEGDTMIRYGGGSDIAFIDCPMDMQKNTLVLKSDAKTLGPVVQCDNYEKPFMLNGGNVIVDGCANISGYLSWLNSETPGEYSLTVNTNSTLLLNSMLNLDVDSTAYHTLVLKEGAKIRLVGGGDKTFRGGVVFEDPVRNIITANPVDEGRYRINFVCDVKGSGFVAEGDAIVEIRKYNGASYAFSNTSSNGMVVADGALVDLRSNEKDLLNLTATGGDIVVSNGTLCSDNTFYDFAGWNGAVRFCGDSSTWTSHPFYDYDSPWSIAASANRNSIKFNNLHFCGNPAVAFSTDVIVNTLNGLGAVSNTVDVSDSRVYTSPRGDKCRRFKVLGEWNFDVADAMAGGVLATDGRIDFESGAKIRLCGAGKIRNAPYSFVVAYAESGIFGLDVSVLEVEDPERWSLVVGADGKTLLAQYTPKGTVVTIR